MLATRVSEHSKKELQMTINSFDRPTELTDVEAWAQLLLELVFLEPGTFPSLPGMGVGIHRYEYSEMDSAISDLSAKIMNQQQEYLPDIPLAGVDVFKTYSDGLPVLVIRFSF